MLNDGIAASGCDYLEAYHIYQPTNLLDTKSHLDWLHSPLRLNSSATAKPMPPGVQLNTQD